MRIKDLFLIKKGKKATESPHSDLRYIQIEDLRHDDNPKFASQNRNNVICNEDDILIAWDGANAGTIGYGLEGVVGSTLAILRNKTEKIFTPYAGRFLQSKFKYLRDNCTGATIPHISRPSLENLQIPLPPLPVQRRIAAILDAADEHRRKTEALIEKYDELAQSVFLEMFGDPVRNEKGWEVTTIRNMVQEVKYGTSKKASESGKYPYLRMNNINYNGNMDFSSLKYIDVDDRNKHKYVTKKGDVLFNRTNSKELVGKTGIVSTDDEMILAGYLIRIRVKKGINPYYLWGHLNSPWAKLKLTNMCKNIVGMANINAQELQDIPILHPPIDLQNRFESIIQSIQKQKAIVENSQKHSETLFQSLLQRAFRGELVTEEEVVE